MSSGPRRGESIAVLLVALLLPCLTGCGAGESGAPAPAGSERPGDAASRPADPPAAVAPAGGGVPGVPAPASPDRGPAVPASAEAVAPVETPSSPPIEIPAVPTPAPPPRPSYRACLVKGRVAMRNGDPAAAVEAFRQAVALQPGDVLTRAELRGAERALAARGMDPEEKQAARQREAEELDRRLRAFRQTLRGKDARAAQAAFDHAFDLDPASPLVEQARLELLAMRGRWATENIQRRQAEEAARLVEQARREIAAGRPGDALKTASQARSRAPRDARVLAIVRQAELAIEADRRATASAAASRPSTASLRDGATAVSTSREPDAPAAGTVSAPRVTPARRAPVTEVSGPDDDETSTRPAPARRRPAPTVEPGAAAPRVPSAGTTSRTTPRRGASPAPRRPRREPVETSEP